MYIFLACKLVECVSEYPAFEEQYVSMLNDIPTITMKEENSGTAIVTPDKHREYIRPIFPKKMHTPEAIANPMSGAFSCKAKCTCQATPSSSVASMVLCIHQIVVACSMIIVLRSCY